MGVELLGMVLMGAFTAFMLVAAALDRGTHETVDVEE